MGDRIDHLRLLEKFVEYIIDIEGTDFISDGKSVYSDVEFTEKEWELLSEISNEIKSR